MFRVLLLYGADFEIFINRPIFCLDETILEDLIPGEVIGTIFYPIWISGETDDKCHTNRNSRYSKVSLRKFWKSFKGSNSY